MKFAQLCPTLWNPMDYNSSWNSPGQNTGVGSLPLLQGIFPPPEIELGSPALQVDSLPTELLGKPKKLAYNQLYQGTEDKLSQEEMRRDIIPEK